MCGVCGNMSTGTISLVWYPACPPPKRTHTSAPRTKERTHLSQRMSVCGEKHARRTARAPAAVAVVAPGSLRRHLLEELDVAELRDGIARNVHDGRRAQAHEVLHRVGVHPCRAQHGSQRI